MNSELISKETPQRRRWTWKKAHSWIRVGFICWAIFSSVWLANSVRTKGVQDWQRTSDNKCEFTDNGESITLRPRGKSKNVEILFFCGSGVAAEAYIPLLRPLTEDGVSIHIVRLPWRFAPLESHKEEAVQRALTIIAAGPKPTRWIVAGHSLGAALACRLAQRSTENLAGAILIATTHPKAIDLSRHSLSIMKINGGLDGVAPIATSRNNAHLLPSNTVWVTIDGANHSQFAHYGPQLFDGTPTISRDQQQEQTRQAIRIFVQPETSL
jgi:hypothetical protein